MYVSPLFYFTIFFVTCSNYLLYIITYYHVRKSYLLVSLYSSQRVDVLMMLLYSIVLTRSTFQYNITKLALPDLSKRQELR